MNGTNTESLPLFVYGTLKSRLIRLFLLHSLIKGTPFILRGYEKKGLNVNPCKGKSVNGYLLFVTPRQLERLDKYEDLGTTYKRIKVRQDDTDMWLYIKIETS